MDALIWIALAGVIVTFVALRPAASGRHAMSRAMGGDFEALIASIERKSGEARATAWNQSIKHLWEAYRRRAAALLIVEAGQRSEAMIVQYWIKQCLEIEPEIAQEVFTPEFLAEHFKPDVAAKCGRRGCCG